MLAVAAAVERKIIDKKKKEDKYDLRQDRIL